MATTSVTDSREKLHSLLDSHSLDANLSALVLLGQPNTVEEMTVRFELFQSIERCFPSVHGWVSHFYDCEDDDPCWDLDMVDVFLLAREDLGL